MRLTETVIRRVHAQGPRTGRNSGGVAMNRSRRVLPPKIALIAIITMSALHGVVPLTIVVRAPFSYAGALFLGTGAAMIIWSRRAFHAAGTPIRLFTESTVLICHGLYGLGRSNSIRRG
jgi:hypothetical protein